MEGGGGELSDGTHQGLGWEAEPTRPEAPPVAPGGVPFDSASNFYADLCGIKRGDAGRSAAGGGDGGGASLKAGARGSIGDMLASFVGPFQKVAGDGAGAAGRGGSSKPKGGGGGGGGGGGRADQQPAVYTNLRARSTLAKEEAELTSTGDVGAGADGRRNAAVGAAIQRHNVGYQMLKGAGWEEGLGLGVGGQGMQAPLRAHQPGGRKGIGAAGWDAGPPPAKKPRGSAAAEGAGAGKRGGGGAAASGGGGGASGKGGGHERPKDEVLEEAEKKEARDRAISRYVYSALSDTAPGSATTDVNPLLRGRGAGGSVLGHNPLLRPRRR